MCALIPSSRHEIRLNCFQRQYSFQQRSQQQETLADCFYEKEEENLACLRCMQWECEAATAARWQRPHYAGKRPENAQWSA